MATTVGFFLAVRIAIVLIWVRVLGADPREGAEASLGLNALLLGCACFHSLGASVRTFGSILRIGNLRWVAAFLAFSGSSLLWSATVGLPSSVAYWCSMAVDVGIVVLLLRSGRVPVTAASLMKGFVWGACCIAALAWLMPSQADLRLGDEDFLNTNQIGNLCAFAIFFAQYLMRRKLGSWLPEILFLSVTLLRSLSKTTLLAFALSQAYVLFRDETLSRAAKRMLLVCAGLALLMFWGLFTAYYDVYTNAGAQAETLTGRTGIWLYVANELPNKPWIGHGFDSMWKVIPPFGPDRFEARHAENEILQQAYSYGVVGVVLLFGMYGSLYRDARSLPRGPLRITITSLIIFVGVRGLAEAEPFDLLLPLWAMVLFAMLVANEEPEEHNSLVEAVIGLPSISPGNPQFHTAIFLQSTTADPGSI